MTRLIFLDTETTGLDPERNQVWEVACIVRDYDESGKVVTQDEEHHWFLYVDLAKADLIALNIGRYFERHPTMVEKNHATAVANRATFAGEFFKLSIGAHIVGAVPDFDTRFLAKLLGEYNFLPAWHYHLVCVENLLAGHYQMEPPWKSRDLMEKAGVVNEAAHTAMGDTRAVRDSYDAVMKAP